MTINTEGPAAFKAYLSQMREITNEAPPAEQVRIEAFREAFAAMIRAGGGESKTALVMEAFRLLSEP